MQFTGRGIILVAVVMLSKVEGVGVEIENVPVELRESPCWVVHKGKVPFRADGRGPASSANPSTWNTFDNAVAALDTGDYEGVGYVFSSQENGFIGLDLDHVFDPHTGLVEQTSWDIVQALHTYTEISCSGTGLHSYFRGSKPAGSVCRWGAAEVYGESRYFIVTGKPLTGYRVPCADGQFLLDSLPLVETVNYCEVSGPPRIPDCLALEMASRNTKFSRLYAGDRSGYLHADGTVDPSKSDMALVGILAHFCSKNTGQMDRLFRQSSLYRPKWERALYRTLTLNRACGNKSKA